MQHDLSDVTAQVSALEAKAKHDRVQIRRLSDPRGAVPEIHSRLRYVRANEELVIVTPASSPHPSSP